VERPASEQELVEAVGRAVEVGRAVKVAGSGHSFTDIACTDGHLIRLDRMNRVLDADPASGRGEVEAGITLHELGKELAARGRAMENQGDIDRQTLAGALATATHGTGIGYRNLSAQLSALRLVTADGDVLDLSAHSDADAFLAARVGLGALGVVSAVTLQCVPLFTLRRVDEPRRLEEVLAGLEQSVDDNDHYELYVFPYSRTTITRASERSDRDPEPLPEWRLFIQDVLLENWLPQLVFGLGRFAPRLIPHINDLLGRAFSRSVRSDHSHRVYASRRNIKFTEMEYAIPRDAGEQALLRVLDVIERRRLPVGFPIEMRFVAPDDAYLSTAHGHETCYIAVHQIRGAEFESYFRAVESIMDDYGGRPHWGKRHYQSAATLAPRYPDWSRFQEVRARLDPGGTFRNEYLDRVLGPPRREALA
jgi:FAD-linked oxidoreductase